MFEEGEVIGGDKGGVMIGEEGGVDMGEVKGEFGKKTGWHLDRILARGEDPLCILDFPNPATSQDV